MHWEKGRGWFFKQKKILDKRKGDAKNRACDLKRHLKIHSGEKSYQCNLCDYASVQAGNFRTKFTLEKNHKNATNATLHLFSKVIWGDVWTIAQMQSMRLCICLGWCFEETFETSHWTKISQMQTMWLCICPAKSLEGTLENAYRIKNLQMLSLWLCIFSWLFFGDTSMWLCICTEKALEGTHANAL